MKYSEGTYFLVSLEDGGCAVGVVARASKGGAALLTYHFAPRYETAPTMEEVGLLDPRMPLLIARTGNLSLKDGRWPILGTAAGWCRSDWPMPVFLREEPITGRRIAVHYADHDPRKLLSEEPASAGFYGPLADFWGGGAIESWLTVALTPESDDKGIDNPIVMSPWAKEGFITRRGKLLPVVFSVGVPEKGLEENYFCEVDAFAVLGRVVTISGPNPERTRRNAMTILRVAVNERKVVDAQGKALVVPVF